MKSDIVYGLVSATWPAMIVDEAGAVHNVNPAAVRAFGPSMADGTGTLPALWLPDNQETAAELLARCASQAAVNVPLKLLGKNKANLPYQASICAIQDDGIHPTAKGAELVAGHLLPLLLPLLSQ